MTQSYASWRMSRVWTALRGFLKPIGRLISHLVPFLILIGIVIVVVSFSLWVGEWAQHRLKRVRAHQDQQEAAQAAAVAVEVAASEPAEAAAATPSPDSSEPVVLIKIIRTGVQSIQIMQDQQTGCEYLVIVGRPPVPREIGDKDGFRQWCDNPPPVTRNAEVPATQNDMDGGIR